MCGLEDTVCFETDSWCPRILPYPLCGTSSSQFSALRHDRALLSVYPESNSGMPTPLIAPPFYMTTCTPLFNTKNFTPLHGSYVR